MNREILLKKLYFRSAHRGSKETDIILGDYAALKLDLMNDAELSEFEEFIAENDTDIWNWVVGKTTPENAKYKSLLEELRQRYKVD